MTTFTIETDNCALLMIDMQERFLPAIPCIASDQECGLNCQRLLKGFALLDIPCFISEQYPKGLGHTLSDLSSCNTAAAIYEKTHFSCYEDSALKQALIDSNRDSIILCGVESHVCVLSTACDLLQHGFDVIIAGDAVASRKDSAKDMALDAARDAGALVLPVESILFRLLRRAGGENFKAISALIK